MNRFFYPKQQVIEVPIGGIITFVDKPKIENLLILCEDTDDRYHNTAKIAKLFNLEGTRFNSKLYFINKDKFINGEAILSLKDFDWPLKYAWASIHDALADIKENL